MKRYNNLFDKIASYENLDLAERKARKGKGGMCGVRLFDKNREENLRKIHEMLVSGNYHTSKYTTFEVYDPKHRIIFRLPYNPDRIVHHAIMNVLEPIWVKQFTRDTYSCIKGRGVHGAYHAVRLALKDYENTKYCLQIDVKKFYPSIDHDILKTTIRRKIKDKRLLELLDEIIDSADGVPIGNYLSQFFANLYLSSLDHYTKEVLRVKHYFRYADDMIVLSGSKSELVNIRKKIEAKLKEVKLAMKKNWHIFPVDSRGIDFLGFVFYHRHIRLRKRIKRRMTRKVMRAHRNGKDKQEIHDIIASWWGWLKYTNSINLVKTIEKSLGYEIKFNRHADRIA